MFFIAKLQKANILKSQNLLGKEFYNELALKTYEFTTYAETNRSYQAMTGSSLLIIGKSLVRKSTQSTEVYARINNDPVRSSVRKAMDKILEYKDKEQ